MNDQENTLKDFEQYINKLVEKKVYEILDRLGIEASSYAIVDRIDTNTDEVVTNIVLKTSTGNIIDSIENKSGETLSVGDTVKIYGSRKNMANRYIGIKCGTLAGTEVVAELTDIIEEENLNETESNNNEEVI